MCIKVIDLHPPFKKTLDYLKQMGEQPVDNLYPNN